MFRVLLKKQLFEIFRSWFYDRKNGKARSKKGTAIMILLFALLMIVVLGGAFTAIAIGIAGPFISAGADYLYFILFGLISVAVGLFGCVFNTYSSLYLAKDNDLLLSLPIPTGVIVSTRLFGTYLIGILYSAVVFLPAAIVHQIVGGFNPSALIGNISMLFEISLIVWALSCLLGFAVAKISLKIKNRGFIGVFTSIAFMGLYYFFYFKAQTLIRNMAISAAIYGAKIKGSAYVLYVWGSGGAGQLSDMPICLAVCVAFALLVWALLNKTFLKIVTATPKEKKAAAHRVSVRASRPSTALLKKEFSRFASSANYMLNCGFGILFLPAAGIALLIKGSAIVSAFSAMRGFPAAMLPIGISGIACMLISMIDPAAPSISLEGKGLWILQSLPIDPWQIVMAKIKTQLMLAEFPTLFFCGCVAALNISAPEKAMCIALSLLFPVFSSLSGMYIGLKMPILDWTNEIVPIKQSGGVAIALFSGWGFAVLLIGGYAGLSAWLGTFSAAAYLAAFTALLLIASAFLYRRLKTHGAEMLKAL